MENKEKFEKLMQDESFIMKILELQTYDDVKAEFKANGVDLSEEEIEKLGDNLRNIAEIVEKEDLNNISGGIDRWDQIKNKAADKLGEGLGQAVWIIPTVALTTLVSTVVKWWADRKLKEYEQKNYQK